MLLLRMILHPSSLASLLYTHITHTYAILFKDLTYHHEFLMKEQKMELKLLRCVLSPMPEIAREINSVISKVRPEETAAELQMEMAEEQEEIILIIFPNMKPYPNNAVMPVIPLHLALPENIPLILVLPIIPIIKNVFVMKI